LKGIEGFNPDFLDMVAALCDAGVQFLLIGAFAVSLHGHPRTTGDLDVFVRPDAANADRIWLALQRFGAPVQALGIEVTDFVKPDTVIQFGVPPRRIDLVTDISGATFEEAWASRVEVTWGDRCVPFLGLATLLANKRATGRPKDILDIAALERVIRRGGKR
jgi:hypothetical protein